ncbi:hypothetical protein EJB05_16093, partial [Eragrostis curvula]
MSGRTDLAAGDLASLIAALIALMAASISLLCGCCVNCLLRWLLQSPFPQQLIALLGRIYCLRCTCYSLRHGLNLPQKLMAKIKNAKQIGQVVHKSNFVVVGAGRGGAGAEQSRVGGGARRPRGGRAGARRVNALENVVKLRLENTIAYIKGELDEQEREEFFRLKKIQGYKQRELEHQMESAQRYAEEKVAGEVALKRGVSMGTATNMLDNGDRDEDIIF